MAHKVEIQNLLDASRGIDPTIRELRNNFQNVVNKLDILHNFIETACADCADDNDIVIKRAAFQSRIDDVNTALDAAKTAAAAGSYLALADYWSVDIADTSGLTNPVAEEPAVEEPAPTADPEPTPDPDPTDTTPASGA
jgi:hypothetical protein